MKVKHCPIQYTAEVIGDTWTILLLRELFAGNDRFDGLLARVGASSSILSNRLKKMMESGVVEREPYQEKPTRYRYRLTEAGHSLFPVFLAAINWGNQWSPYGPTVRIFHGPCGEILPKGGVCPQCGGELNSENTRFKIVPPAESLETET